MWTSDLHVIWHEVDCWSHRIWCHRKSFDLLSRMAWLIPWCNTRRCSSGVLFIPCAMCLFLVFCVLTCFPHPYPQPVPTSVHLSLLFHHLIPQFVPVVLHSLLTESSSLCAVLLCFMLLVFVLFFWILGLRLLVLSGICQFCYFIINFCLMSISALGFDRYFLTWQPVLWHIKMVRLIIIDKHLS